MTTVRRQLRVGVAVWIVCQAALLAALVPRDCCGAHQPVSKESGRSCHETAAVDHCPMRAADGTPCPMHRESGAGRSSDDECTIRGTCGGPMAALVTLLSSPGVLTESHATMPAPGVSRIAVPARDTAVSRPAPPDPPPPRA
jgi:hypothetical protein